MFNWNVLTGVLSVWRLLALLRSCLNCEVSEDQTKLFAARHQPIMTMPEYYQIR